MSWGNRGNSREAWEGAFAIGGIWDQAGGDDRTAAFARVLIDLLPLEVEAYMSQPCTVLDWGCARGNLTDALRRRFPEATVAGLDFAANAVEQARRRYGNPFIWSEDGIIHGTWDVIVASNVLEHVLDPIALMREHLAHTGHYYLALSPWEESLGPGEGLTPEQRQIQGHAHLHRFNRDTFPVEVDGWAKVSEGLAPMRAHWHGTQVLVVYGR